MIDDLKDADTITLVAGELLAIARAHRNVIPPAELVARMCARCAADLIALLPESAKRAGELTGELVTDDAAAGKSDRLEITVAAHPSSWANVLRRLIENAERTRASIKAGLADGSIRTSEATVWLMDLDHDIEPIIFAAREACEQHPSWRRWFADTPVGDTSIDGDSAIVPG